MMDFYYFYPACSMATHIALEESGLEFNPISVSIHNAIERDSYTRINPKGTVPAIVVDGNLLTENIAILNYIARLAPDSKLLPDDPWQAAQCVSLLGWYSSSVHIAFRQGVRPERFSDDPASYESIRKHGRESFWQALQILDNRLAKQPFLLGYSLTLADTYPVVFYNWALIGGYEIGALKNLSSFKDRMLARPTIRRVLEREGCESLG